MATVPYTPEVADLLREKRISLDWHKDGARPAPSSLTFIERLQAEGYSGTYQGGNLATIGAMSYSHSPVNPYMSIGRYCSISWGMTITGSRHPIEWLTTSNITFDRAPLNIRQFHEDHDDDEFFVGAPRIYEKPYPTIGHDVWLGQNVTLNRGVNIGNGAVVAAFSVVTKDVPPYAIVGGNPAKVIRYRFPDELVERLQSVEWWNYHPVDFAHQDMRDVEKMLEFFEKEHANLRPFEPPVLTFADLMTAAGNE